MASLTDSVLKDLSDVNGDISKLRQVYSQRLSELIHAKKKDDYQAMQLRVGEFKRLFNSGEIKQKPVTQYRSTWRRGKV
jgi:hypothetical protein